VSLPTVKVPGVIKPVGAVRFVDAGYGVGVGALPLVALAQGKALEVGVPVGVLPVEVLPQAASNSGNMTKAKPDMMLIAACCHLFWR